MESIKNQKRSFAFTLIELIVTIIIIGILASVAAPTYSNYIKSTKEKSNAQLLNSMRKILDNYYLSYGEYPNYTQFDSIGTIMNDGARPIDHLTLFVDHFKNKIPINAFCKTLDELKDDTMQDIYQGTVYDNGVHHPYDMQMIDDGYISTDVLGIIPIVENSKVVDYQIDEASSTYILYGNSQNC